MGVILMFVSQYMQQFHPVTMTLGQIVLAIVVIAAVFGGGIFLAGWSALRAVMKRRQP